jgi:hypothetical protein
MMQGRQQMGQQMGQIGQGLGQGMSQGQGQGNTALGQSLLSQIQQMKQDLGYGGVAQGGREQAGSGWGLGTSPYAADPAPADASNVVEDRQGDQSLGDTAPVDFEALYAPEEYAHGFTSENQLHGKFDPTAEPQKVEEVRSAPESQEALTEYADILGPYVEGEESAINREQVPLEYQQLVREYFGRVAELSNADGSDAGGGEEAAAAEEDAGGGADEEAEAAEAGGAEDAGEDEG